MVGVHIILRKGHEKEDVRRTYDEARIPNGRIETQPKGWWYCFAEITLPNLCSDVALVRWSLKAP